MGIFNFGLFGEQQHRTFHYTPRYYDPEEDARKAKFGDVDGTREREIKEGTYVPGSYIKGAFTTNKGRYKSHTNKLTTYIGLAGLILLAIALVYFVKLYVPMTKAIADQHNAAVAAEQDFPEEEPFATVGEITIID